MIPTGFFVTFSNCMSYPLAWAGLPGGSRPIDICVLSHGIQVAELLQQELQVKIRERLWCAAPALTLPYLEHDLAGALTWWPWQETRVRQKLDGESLRLAGQAPSFYNVWHLWNDRFHTIETTLNFKFLWKRNVYNIIVDEKKSELRHIYKTSMEGNLNKGMLFYILKFIVYYYILRK